MKKLLRRVSVKSSEKMILIYEIYENIEVYKYEERNKFNFGCWMLVEII
ncbi:hypothetical protein [Clostridium yunnanense]|nr:hypothetical protein [Clostridium yunnanense]